MARSPLHRASHGPAATSDRPPGDRISSPGDDNVTPPRPGEELSSSRFAFPALLLANLFLAFGPWLVRLSDVGPVAAAFWRVTLAVPVLLVLAGLGGRGRLRAPPAILFAIVLAGLFFALDLAAWHWGIVRTKLANATLFGNASSLLFPLYGFLIARAWPRPFQAAALALAMVGIMLLLGRSAELSARHLSGDLFALLAGALYSAYLIVVDRARRTMAPMPVLALSSIAGVIPLLILALLLGEEVMPRDWTPLILLALGSQLLGQGLLVYAIGHCSPLLVGVTFLTQPIVNAALGAFYYGERLGFADFVGALLICAAMVMIRLPGRLDSRRSSSHLPHDDASR